MKSLPWSPEPLAELLFYRDGKLWVACSVEACTAERQTAGKSDVLNRWQNSSLREGLLFCASHGGRNAKPSKQEVQSWPVGHRRCRICLIIKPFDQFHKHNGCLFGVNSTCKSCRKPISKTKYQNLSWEQKLFYRAKRRAHQKDLIFNITVDDIQIPSECPILKKSFEFKSESPYVPSLDRIDPNLGYSPDNVQVVSRRANVLKNNMTKEEALLLSNWLSTN